MNPSFLADVVPSPASGPIASWAMWLGVTLVIELSVVAVVWRVIGRVGALSRWIAGCAIGNVISHPLATLVWVGLPVLTRYEKLAAFALIEVVVTIFEAWVYQRVTRAPAAVALLVSAIANGVTSLIAVFLVFVA